MSHRHAMFILYGIIIGVISAILVGWYFGEAALKIEWIGTLFLNALKMMVVPLIITAVITGVTALGDVRKLGQSGIATLVYYVGTTALAVMIGLIFVNMIGPGNGVEINLGEMPERVASKQNMGVTDILLSMVSPNVIKSAADTQLLPVIVFSLVFGAALTTVGEKGAKTIEVFEGINETMMRLVTWLMYLAPIGIFALVSSRLGRAGGGAGMLVELQAVGMYVVTVISALAVHAVVLLTLLLTLSGFGLKYVGTMMRALLTAFGTASSSATLPLTMECAREAGVHPRSVRFVLPLGSTVNMNGTALYEAVAALFIAQVYGIDLTMGQQGLIVITATLAGIGAAGIPEAGLVTMVIVLKAVGLPLEGIGLILAVDWFLDRFRTSVNVWGDAVGAAVMNKHFDGHEAEPVPA